MQQRHLYGVLALLGSLMLGSTQFGCGRPLQQAESTMPKPGTLAQLGRHFFFDTRLSANGTKSCATCHDPKFAFSDGYRRSSGIYADPTLRNAPSLLNTALMPALNWAEPDVRSFQEQMLRPLFGDTPHEMGLKQSAPFKGRFFLENDQGLSLDSVLRRFESDTLYQRLIRQAYPQLQGRMQQEHLYDALAAFEQTLTSFNSPYDAYLRGDTLALSPAAKRGMALFFGKRLQCGKCHTGPLLSDGKYHNIGYYNPAEDDGVFQHTKRASDKGKFRTPSLRNIAMTAPYFHSGDVAKLSDVVAIFAQGGQQRVPHPNKNKWVQDFQISPTESRELLLFLEHLSDPGITENPWFNSPF